MRQSVVQFGIHAINWTVKNGIRPVTAGNERMKLRKKKTLLAKRLFPCIFDFESEIIMLN